MLLKSLMNIVMSVLCAGIMVCNCFSNDIYDQENRQLSIAALSTAQFAAFSTSQIRHTPLTTAQITALTTAQITALTSAQAFNFTGTQIDRMNLNQLGANQAFDIHSYARVGVRVPKSSTMQNHQSYRSDWILQKSIREHFFLNVTTPTSQKDQVQTFSTMRLDEAIMYTIEKRVGVAPLLKEGPIKAWLSIVVNKLYIETERQAAHAVITKGWNINTPRRLGLVIVFITTYYPGSIDSWAKGYITESINAYKNGPSSCSKGIDERIMTGLRGIDDELDAIFSTPERNLMIKNFFATLNIGEEKRARYVAKMLIERGVSSDSTDEEAAIEYKGFLQKHVTSHGGGEGEHAARIAAEVNLLREFYDDTVRVQIGIIERQMNDQNREVLAMKREDALSAELRSLQARTKEISDFSFFAA